MTPGAGPSMADTIVGTAGIFFTLAVIAVLSFVVGLVIFALLDFAKTTARHGRGRGHGGPRPSPAHVPSPLHLADRVCKAAAHAAEGLVNRFPPRAGEERSAAQWWASVEFAALFMRALENHLAERLEGSSGESFLRAFADVCAGNLYRAEPHRNETPVHYLLQDRLIAYRRESADFSDLLTPAPALFNQCALHIAERWNLHGPSAVEPLTAAVHEMIQNAVTLELAPALR